MDEMTDDELLAQLNSQSSITDDELLKQLNSKQPGWRKSIENDVRESLRTAPGAIGEMIYELPGQAYEAAKQAFTDPSRAAGNLGAGLIQGGRAVLNAPSNVYEYLGEKGVPYFNESDVMAANRAFRIGETNLEKRLLPEKGTEGPADLFWQSLTGFLPATKVGKSASALSGTGKRAAGAFGVASGMEDVNPIHAALMGPALELGGKGAAKGISKVNEKVPLGTLGAGAATAGLSYALGMPDLITALGSAGAGYLANKGFSPKKYAQREAFEHLSPERITPFVEASQRLGLDFVTPAEASRTTFHGKKGGEYGATGESSNIYSTKLEARENAIKGTINNFLDDIYSEARDQPIINKGYQETKKVKIPLVNIKNLLPESEVLAQAIERVDNEAAHLDKFKREKLTKSDLGYWDLVRDALYELEDSKTSKHGKPTTTSREYSNARTTLVDILDTVSPEYGEVRALKERAHTREGIERIFAPASKSLSAKDLGNALKNDKTFKDLMFRLRDMPELQAKVLDMRTVFPELIGPYNHKNAEFGKRAHVKDVRNAVDALKDIAKGTVGESYEKAIVDLVTSPEWPELLKGMNAQQSPGSVLKLLQSFGKAGKYGAESKAVQPEGDENGF
jgi:hypothetical protein